MTEEKRRCTNCDYVRCSIKPDRPPEFLCKADMRRRIEFCAVCGNTKPEWCPMKDREADV